jgi:DNA mismatch repair protein MutS
MSIKNYNVSVREAGNKVIFLRKLVPGGSQHSFGIHVAKMAGMPPALVTRANDILKQLEEKSIAADIKTKAKTIAPIDYQLNIFQVEVKHWKAVKEILEAIDINTISPMDALLKLNEIKGKLKSAD